MLKIVSLLKKAFQRSYGYFVVLSVLGLSLVMNNCGGNVSGTIGLANASSTKDIAAFSFTKVANGNLSTDTASTINGTNISVTLPYGVSRTGLIATFSITGASVRIGSITQASGSTTNDFTNPVTYTVVAADGSTKDYTVTVTNAANTAKDVTAYAIQGTNGTINGTNISVTLPYGVSRTGLIATFSITGASIRIGSVTQASGSTTNDFTNPVTYTVVAADGSTKDYTVTVTNAANTAKDVTAYAIQGTIGTINGTNISVTLPYEVSRTGLIATFSITGASIRIGSVTQASGSTTNDFTNPVTYTVVAADGSTKDYTVTVTNAANTAKDVTAYAIQGTIGTINGTNISVTLPYGVSRTGLIATFTITGASVKIGGITQASGSTTNDFTNPVTYTVVAADGSTKDYTVTVTNAANTAKDITSFSILGINSSIVGTAITVTVPNGTNLTALVATFSLTGQSVMVGSTIQISGVTTNDYTNPKTYIVVAEDTSTKNYTVSVTAAPAPNTQIIADHTVVDKYSLIPQRYLDEVKKMWINIPGESHSYAYRYGMSLLMQVDSKFAANVVESGTSPELPTDQHLRVNQFVREASSWNFGSGEAGWYTWYAYPLAEQPAFKDRIKHHIKYSYDNNYNLTAIGFGWCWDMTWISPGGTIDPIYNVHWAGASIGGPDGSRIWGLDAGDFSLTGNRVSMDTYLSATEEYRLFAQSIGAPTKVIFTTGPVDADSGENGYQRQLKHEYIRDYVKASSSRILFDYADILSFNNTGIQQTISWNGHTYPVIHSDNLGDGSIGHIGSAGALRLAKAQWWLLARIAGWDGVSP